MKTGIIPGKLAPLDTLAWVSGPFQGESCIDNSYLLVFGSWRLKELSLFHGRLVLKLHNLSSET